jgi:hypothetical protein
LGWRWLRTIPGKQAAAQQNGDQPQEQCKAGYLASLRRHHPSQEILSLFHLKNQGEIGFAIVLEGATTTASGLQFLEMVERYSTGCSPDLRSGTGRDPTLILLRC